MNNTIMETILQHKIVAITRGIPSENVLTLAQALYAGGVRCMEITFDQASQEKREDTLKSIALLKQEMGDRLLIGAGTVMTVEQVRAAAQAGAEYMISPNVNDEVIRETKRLGKISIPGAMTPSEIAHAFEIGGDIIKVFPAGNLGPSYLKALSGPMKHIPLMATGGITVENCKDFLNAGSVGLGIGGNLVSASLLREGKIDELTQIAKAYVAAVSA